MRKRRARARLAALQAHADETFAQLTAEPVRELPDFSLPRPVRRRGSHLEAKPTYTARTRG